MSLSPAQEPAASHRTDRGQSNPLGVILVFAIMIAGASVVIILGAAAMDDTEGRLSEQRAEKVMTQLDSEASLVALGETNTQRLSYSRGSGERFRVKNQTGWMRVNITNKTTGDPKTLIKEPMGEVVFDQGDTSIAYQGGGVWRKDNAGTFMISPPEMHYRNATLTLPLVTVSGDASLGTDAHILKNGSTEKQFPDPGRLDEWTNPLDNHEINVSIQSEYYEAWGRYLETRTDGQVIYDHDDNIVHALLVVPAENPAVNAGIVSGSAGATLTIKNQAKVDSYDSRTATYGGDLSNSGGCPCPDTSDTKVVASGHASIENNAIVFGDIEVGRSLEIDNNGELHDGNISYGESISGGGWDSNWIPGEPDFWHAQNSSVKAPDSVSFQIDGRLDSLSDPANNDNDLASDIQNPNSANPTLDTCPCTLDAGTYYLSEINVDTDKLTLDTSSGNIDIAVDGDVAFPDTSGGEFLEIAGNNRVNIYTDGDVVFQNDVEVANADDNATQFWIYTYPDASVTISNGAVFKGVIYGPGNPGNVGADITLDQNAEIFGSVVGDVTFAANNVHIHYDEALQNADTIEQFGSIPALTYLHVSINRIQVTD